MITKITKSIGMSNRIPYICAIQCKLLQGYVLTRFQWFHTFAFQNPNVSKNGNKRTCNAESSRKNVCADTGAI